MLSRETFRDIEAMIRPIRTRADNMIARGVVTLVNAAVKMQILQVGIQDREPVDDAEHFQPYGFKSIPRVGAESVVLFIGGDRGVPVAVVTDDRRTRPVAGWTEGESGLYNDSGAVVHLKEDGTIEARSGGVAIPLATKADLDAHRAWVDAHTHTITSGSSAGLTTAPATLPSPTPVGTTKFKAE